MWAPNRVAKLMNFAYTAEIFTDADACNPIDAGLVEAGLAIVGRHAVTAVVTGTHRKLRVSRPGATVIDVTKVRWPGVFAANVNILLTDRQILPPSAEGSSNRQLGLSLNDGAKRIAIVHTGVPEAVVAQTVAHEIGHLFGVPIKPTAPGNHCSDDACIMYTSITSYDTYEPDVSTMRARLKNHFAVPDMRPVIQYQLREDFCEQCASDLPLRLGKLSTSFALQTMKNLN